MAHGYLLASYLSPLTNRRTDRMAAASRIVCGFFFFRGFFFFNWRSEAVRAQRPADKPLSVRIGDRRRDGGLSDEDALTMVRAFAAGHRFIEVFNRSDRTGSEDRLYGRCANTLRDKIRH